MESINTLADMTESPLEAPEVLRRRLKDALRKARENADLTQKAVAQQLDWSPSKIIRIEQGAVGVSSTDVRALLRLYGVDDESQVRELTELAKRSRKQSWSEYKDVYSQVSLTLFAYESAAKRILNYEPTFIPGLLQTEEYAQALLRGLGHSEERVDLKVRARLARQELLERSPHDRLKELASLPGIKIQVLTFDVGVHPSMGAAFTILEFDGLDDLLYLESSTGDHIYRDDPDLISKYRENFATLESLATSPDELSPALDKISKRRFG
jgi:transcriptional regulator with XRE-family HTH domain